jgi:hypothetical protein
MSPYLYSHVLSCLLLWVSPNPANVKRLSQLVTVAADIASTDASVEEAELLAAIAIHESMVVPGAKGDGGKAIGAFQVRGKDGSAREALRRVRWSYAVCHDLSAYSGCGRCGSCPEIVASLQDPTLPRR